MKPSGVERIADAFAGSAQAGRAALMPYMMAGFPDAATSLAIATAYAEAGVELIELGVPFSDPLADGPTIHAAATTALAAGATLDRALEICESVAERVPVVLMIYMNMILALGGAVDFARRAERAGAVGVIVPDLPQGEAEELDQELHAVGLALVSLVAPTTPESRRAEICAAARGFIYLVSTVGTTGERDALPDGLAGLIAATKSEADVPVAVGFGITTPAQAAQVGALADGVIIGTRLVRAAAEAEGPVAAAEAVGAFLGEAREALAS